MNTCNSERPACLPGILIIPPVFFVTGFAGLVYEIIWTRLVSEPVGGGSFAMSVVLAVFMAGLALGSAVASILVRRMRYGYTALLVYGILEILLAVLAPAAEPVLRLIQPVYAAAYGVLQGSTIGYAVAGALISAPVVLVPAVIMGMTLPLLLRYCATDNKRAGSMVGMLYGINTLGAAAGAVMCGFWMIYLLGMRGSILATASLNLSAGVIAATLALYAKSRCCDPGHGTRAGISGGINPAGHGIVIRMGLILMLSGFCSMSYEVIWTRLLSLLAGPTTYSLTIVLAAFITGLGGGSILFGRLADRSPSPFRFLVAMQVAASASALAAGHALGNSQEFFSYLLYMYRDSGSGVELAKAAALFGFMLVPTAAFGAAYPLAIRVCAGYNLPVAPVAGRIYAFNTVGATMGALLAGFLMVPAFGKALSLSWLAAIHAAGIFILVISSGEGRRWRAVVSAGCFALVIAAFFFPRWNDAGFTSARYHRFDGIRQNWGGSLLAALGSDTRDDEVDSGEIVFLEDGIEGFVCVNRRVNSFGITNYSLSISGKTDASSDGDQNTQVMLAHLPMLIHPGARDIMVLGLASGVTAGEFLNYPVEQVDVLEISPEVVRASGFFRQWNNNVLEDPRVNIIVQDARTHLALTDRRYDVISSEPSNPWMAGIAALFTEDFFRDIRERLNPGGVFVQWIHSYQIDWESFAMIGRTFNSVFPDGLLFKTSPLGSDYLLVAARDMPLRMDTGVMGRNMPYAAKSRNMRLAMPELLFPLVIADNLAGLYGPGLVNSHNHPFLEYSAPRRLYKGNDDFRDIIFGRRQISPYIIETAERINNNKARLAMAEYMASVNIPPFQIMDYASAGAEDKTAFEGACLAYAARNPIDNPESIPWPGIRRACFELQSRLIRDALGRKGSPHAARPEWRATAFYELGRLEVFNGMPAEAADSFRQALRYAPMFFNARQNLAFAYELSGQHAAAVPVLEELLGEYPWLTSVKLRLSANMLALRMTDRAVSLLQEITRDEPSNAAALQALGAIYGTTGDFEKAVSYSIQAIRADASSLKAYQNLVLALLHTGRAEEAETWIQAGLHAFPGNTMLTDLAGIVDQYRKTRQ